MVAFEISTKDTHPPVYMGLFCRFAPCRRTGSWVLKQLLIVTIVAEIEPLGSGPGERGGNAKIVEFAVDMSAT